MILIPIAIDPFGRFGPILQTFLYDTQPTNPITFTPTKPNATSMYHKITHFPSPKGILKLANHNWKLTQTRGFYGHSYSAPTPMINTLQQIGLTITKAFAIHIRYVRQRFLHHSAITLTSIDRNLNLNIYTIMPRRRYRNCFFLPAGKYFPAFFFFRHGRFFNMCLPNGNGPIDIVR